MNKARDSKGEKTKCTHVHEDGYVCTSMHMFAQVCRNGGLKVHKYADTTETMAVVRLKMGMYVHKYAEKGDTMAVVRLANLLHLWSTP